MKTLGVCRAKEHTGVQTQEQAREQTSPRRLLMIPGPVPVAEPVLEAASRQVDSFTSQEFVEIFNRVADRLRSLFQTRGRVVVFPGSGTLAMEGAVANTVNASSRVLAVVNGKWGSAFASIAEVYGATVDVLAASPGKVVSAQEVADKLRQHRYDVVLTTHIDTATGAMAPMDEMAAAVRDNSDSLLVVDSVCSAGAVPEEMDAWGADVVVTASQKALAAPPGLSIVAFNERALQARRRLGKISSFYLDWLHWTRVLDNPMRETHITHPVNLFYALDEALRLIMEEGPENRFRRHQQCAEALRAGLRGLGLGILTEEPFAAPTVTAVLYPQGVEDEAFRAQLKVRGLVVGPFAVPTMSGRGMRVGHMGNVQLADIEQTLSIIAEVLNHRV